ncbi:MFS transporter [Microbispora sp. RL4-1S]|uniref:MFS transporter n=1 Tax=Microbispora oryzae TaxID=2806554 RepID=A0A940WDI8_9ACTN|nr:MFS transporter [Microbispora oryzae]
MLGISLGYFVVLLDTGVLAVAEPDLARSLGASTAALQWTVTAYTVAFGALLLSGGAAADRYGAHRLFRAGVAAFGLVSLLCALAPDVWTLVALRAVLGVAAAAVVPASMAMIAGLYPQPVARARAVAAWAAISGAALVAGPVAGGLLVGLAGWPAVFLINVPLAAVTLTLTAGSALRRPRGDRRVDWPGQVAACAALALLTDAVIALGAGEGVHAACSAAACAGATAAFAARERRSTSLVLPPAVLRAPGMAAAMFSGGVVNFALSALLFALPLLLPAALRLTPAQTGAAFLPMTLPFALNPLVTGGIVARFGPRPPVLAGLGLLTAAGAALGAALAAGAPYPVVAAGLAGVGVGVSLALPALVALVVSAAPEGAAGSAGGLLNAVRQAGATVGVAVAGAFVGVAPGGGPPLHPAAVPLVTAGVCAAAAAVVALAGGRSVRDGVSFRRARGGGRRAR